MLSMEYPFNFHFIGLKNNCTDSPIYVEIWQHWWANLCKKWDFWGIYGFKIESIAKYEKLLFVPLKIYILMIILVPSIEYLGTY